MADLPKEECAKCGCLKSGHHGVGIGCEGAGGNCRCDGVFVPRTPPREVKPVKFVTVYEVKFSTDSEGRTWTGFGGLYFDEAEARRAAGLPSNHYSQVVKREALLLDDGMVRLLSGGPMDVSPTFEAFEQAEALRKVKAALTKRELQLLGIK